MPDYNKMSHEDFCRLLGEVMDEQPASHLLSYPEVYDVVAEIFNNDVLDRWAAEQEEGSGHGRGPTGKHYGPCHTCDAGELYETCNAAGRVRLRCDHCGYEVSFTE